VSLARTWRTRRRLAKLAAAAMLTDATWGWPPVVAPTAQARRRYYFAPGLILWSAGPPRCGAIAGGWLQQVPVTTLLPSLTLGALAVGQLRNRPALAAGRVLRPGAGDRPADAGSRWPLTAAAGTSAAWSRIEDAMTTLLALLVVGL
jgi:hypothetical protein